MNTVLPTQPFLAPHLRSQRFSPSRSGINYSSSTQMSGRKRKADDSSSGSNNNNSTNNNNNGGNDGDTRMSRSPSTSPSIANSSLPSSSRHRGTKRVRTNMAGRRLMLPRLLETLSAEDMRSILNSICDRHPDITSEVVSSAPRPSVESVLEVLSKYEENLRTAFPLGPRSISDYAYNRVRQPLIDLLDALRDYTPTFLSPHETQTTVSLNYLDGVTNLVHRLPNWESFQHNRHKHEAYEELAKSWAIAVREESKRAAGIQLRIGGWDQKLAKHNETSGNRLEEAMHELRSCLGWMAPGGTSSSSNNNSSNNDNNNNGGQDGSSHSNDPALIRQQLLNGTYGLGGTVRVGPW